MRRKLMTAISAVLVLVMFAGSTLAFAAPMRDVQIEQFSALQGIQVEPLSSLEAEQIKGSINWGLLASLAKMWSGILYGMSTIYAGGATIILSSIAWGVSNAYLDYKDAKISEEQAKKKLDDSMKKYNELRKKNPKLPKL